MKQEDTYKILAIFLGLTMVFSIFAYIFVGPSGDTDEQTNERTQEMYYDPELWTVSQPFDSITDALNLTPVGAEFAHYVDLESMNPQMEQWARQDLPVIGEVDSIYNSSTRKMYYTSLKEENISSFLLLSTMFPEKNEFEYIVLPDSYPPILLRQEQGISGLYNIMGNPTILSAPQTAVDTLEIIYSLNKTNTSYDIYEGLLGKVPAAPFQTISSNVTFAEQYYMGVNFKNGSYERTTAYLNINSSIMNNLTRLKDTSTERGFTEYNVTKSGDYTVVRILGSDMFRVLSEESS
jgi:hypothetical protein